MEKDAKEHFTETFFYQWDICPVWKKLQSLRETLHQGNNIERQSLTGRRRTPTVLKRKLTQNRTRSQSRVKRLVFGQDVFRPVQLNTGEPPLGAADVITSEEATDQIDRGDTSDKQDEQDVSTLPDTSGFTKADTDNTTVQYNTQQKPARLR
ncbi:Hypothetical predicted protein [Mytilus galloprovincialis]|uniref:Uncharacterized protein n=1 Tax=Mytilus galloprovincialis TaxID=29158 RepID=A0A8B6ECG5_MYTGA|nr:Hypothetical predicted protein [Mytilus galloprovincialis]